MRRREFIAMAAAACTGAVGAHGQPAASGKGGAHRYVRDLETAYDVDVFVAGGVPWASPHWKVHVD